MSSSVAEAIGKFDVFLQLYVRGQRQENDSLEPDRPAARYKAIAGGGGEVRRR
jgi:hypothetical protein